MGADGKFYANMGGVMMNSKGSPVKVDSSPKKAENIQSTPIQNSFTKQEHNTAQIYVPQVHATPV